MKLKSALLAGVAAFAFAGTAYAEGCDKVVFSDVGWTDITATTAATTLVLEALGYETETKVLSVPVTYTGILPDLFGEGQGVVASGTLGEDGVFRATEVLAKHDENYMPPEVQHALDKAGTSTAAQPAAKLPEQAYQ